jgi:hypothetical protein
MKKIILAVIISIIGITASAQNLELADCDCQGLYEVLYEQHRDRIYNYCNSDDTRFVRQWYTRNYHPSILSQLNLRGQSEKFMDLITLETVWRYTVEEAVYFFIAMKCAHLDERVGIVANNLLEQKVIEKLESVK